jgi:hypothetical protein
MKKCALATCVGIAVIGLALPTPTDATVLITQNSLQGRVT